MSYNTFKVQLININKLPLFLCFKITFFLQVLLVTLKLTV